MNIADKFKREDPEPVVGEMIPGQVEIQFEGKKKWDYFGFVERFIIPWEYKGEDHRIYVYTLMAKKEEYAVTLCSMDSDLVTDSEPISYGETSKGMKRKTKLVGVVMILIDAIFMYLLYLFASSGYAISYNPQASSTIITLIETIAMGFALLIIYVWYSSKVTVHSMYLKPLSSDNEGSLTVPMPVMLVNNRRIPLDKWISNVVPSSDVEGILSAFSRSIQSYNASAARTMAMRVNRAEDASAREHAAKASEYTDSTERYLSEKKRIFVRYSWLPVVISIAIVVAGFVALYMVFG